MSGFVLKIIALTSMLIDHTGCAFQFVFDTFFMRSIGRIAFPIYVFLTGEGCRHTKDLKKYVLRLGIFALISEFPFDFFFANANRRGPHPLYFFDMENQNVFFTLFFGALAIYLFEIRKGKDSPLKNPFFHWASWAAILMGWAFRVDYGAAGVGFIILIYALQGKKEQILALQVMIFYLYIGDFSSYYIMLFSGACLSLVCIYLYNGRRGPSLKWLFYIMYPLHLSLLGALWYFYIAPVLLR